MTDFRARYGPYALVTGASEGIGECFARLLAARGLHLLARGPAHRAPRGARRRSCATAHGVEVRTLSADVGRPDLVAALDAVAAGAEVGLVVHNAAFSALGPFLDRPLADLQQVIDLNCRAPLALAHHFGRQMVARGRGGILLMSSLAGGQGTPIVAAYAASKAFEIVLAEGLWDELAPARASTSLACRAGPTRTPSYEASRPRKKVPMMEPGAGGRGGPRGAGTEAGAACRGGSTGPSNFVMRRLLSRPAAIRFMGNSTREDVRVIRCASSTP